MNQRTSTCIVAGLATLCGFAGIEPASSNVGLDSPTSKAAAAKVVNAKASTTKPSTAKAKTTVPSTPMAKTTKATTTKAKTTTAKPSAWRSLDVSSKGLKEVSGCAVSRRVANRVWVHNDSGDGPVVVPIDISTGDVGKAVTLMGIDVVDPEDIAVTANGDLILADIGDNSENRTSIHLYRFAEPALNASTAKATRIDLRYPDGPHNAEALVVSSDGSSALVFTKSPTGVAGVYQANLMDPSEQLMSLVGTVTIKGETGYKPNMISAADAVGSTVIVRTYHYGYVLATPNGGTISDAPRATPRRFNVPQMAQGEALCVSADGGVLVMASESQGASTFSVAVGSVPR